MNTRLIALNGNAGALTSILATIPASRIRFREDDAAAATGIQYQTTVDNFVSLNTLASTSEPGAYPADGDWDHFRKLLGLPAQGVSGAFNFRAADTLLKAQGKTASATTLRFEEYE